MVRKLVSFVVILVEGDNIVGVGLYDFVCYRSLGWDRMYCENGI